MRCDVAVIGGTGFIGSALVPRLLAQGRSVRVISRQMRCPAPSGWPDHVRADIADAKSIHSALAGAETVVDLALGGGPTWADFERDFVAGTSNVAAACAAHNVRRLIFVSSIVALDLAAGGAADDAMGTDRRHQCRGHYARGKIRAEEALRRSDGIRFVILRPGVVVGRGGVLKHSALGAWATDRDCLGWGRGDTPVPFVLVQDVAAAIALSLDAPGIDGMAFSLAGDVYLTAAEFVEEMAACSGQPFRYHPRNPAILQASKVAKWIVKCALLRAAPRPSFHDLKNRTLMRQVSSDAAKRILGWRPNANRKVFLEEAIGSYFGLPAVSK